MADEPLAVAAQPPRQREELHADDRERDRRLLRALRGARDQPRRGRDQPDRGGERPGAEQRGERQPARRRARDRERAPQRRLGRRRPGRRRGRGARARRRSCRDLAPARARPRGRRARSAPAGGRRAPPCARATRRRIASSTLALGLAVEVGGRLVEQQQRRVAQERARERDALALAGGEARAALAEHGRRGPAAASRTRLLEPGRGDRRRAPPRSTRRGGRGARSRRSRRRTGAGAAAPTRAARRQASRSSSASSTLADADRARVGRDEAEQHAEQRRLAAPARAGERQDLARVRPSARRRRSAGSARPG